ncbi:MAG: ZIP family metal transporter [archaeon]
MAIEWLYALASVIIVSLVSLIGIITLSVRVENVRRITLYLVSFSAGALLGDAFIHLLPEAVSRQGFGLPVSLAVLLGIALAFIVEKFVHWRHCHLPEERGHHHHLAAMNLVGDGVHNFIDGLTIGASYLAGIPAGIATTIAVVLHEIPQEIGDFGILLHAGLSPRKALFYNFLTALTAVAGTILALALGAYIANAELFLVPLAAGGFIYIASADLFPEMHKEVRPSRSALQFALFCLGIGMMAAMLLLG